MDKYLSGYYKALTRKYEYTKEDLVNKLREIERQLQSGLVITHSTTIDAIPFILEEGLLPAIARRRPSSNSALFEIDHQQGLDQYIFSLAGSLPPYYSKQDRITLLLTKDVLLSQGSFFTWHDLAGVVHFSENDFHDYARMVRQFYFQGRFPASSLFRVLAHTFYYEYGNEWLNKFLEKGYPATFEPDFKHKNGGNPEIKLSGVINPQEIWGFVVYEREHLERLSNLGVSSRSVFLVPDNLTIEEERRWLWSLKSEK